jgi:hypothetical protein
VGLAAQHLGELLGIGEGLPENQSPPTEFEDDVVGHLVHEVCRGCVVQPEGDGLGMVSG